MSKLSIKIISLYIFLCPVIGLCQLPQDFWDARLYESDCGNITGTLTSIAVIGDNVYVGRTLDFTNNNFIMRWSIQDGQWHNVGGGVSGGAVWALVVDGNGDLIVGGGFTSAGGDPSIQKLAKWNVATSSWSSMNFPDPRRDNSTTNWHIRNIKIINSVLYVIVQGQSSCDVRKIYYLNNGNWESITENGLAVCPGPDALAKSPIYTIAEFGNTLVIGGRFTMESGGGRYMARLVNSQWVAFPDGNGNAWGSDQSGIAGGGVVNEIVTCGDYLYFGGLWRRVLGGDDTNYGMAYCTTVSLPPIYIGPTAIDGNCEVYDIHAVGDELYIGGKFIDFNGSVNKIARLAEGTWHGLGDHDETLLNVKGISSDGSGVYFVGDNAPLGNGNNSDLGMLAHWNNLECPKYRDLSHNSITPGVYTAQVELSSSGKITQGSTILSAGSAVILRSFEDCLDFSATVGLGESFTAKIDMCVPPQNLSKIPGANIHLPTKSLLNKNKELLGSSTILMTYSPNPVSRNIGKISFFLSEEELVYLTIRDFSGREIKKLWNGSAMSDGEHTVDFHTDDMQNGIYLIVLSTPMKHISKKLIVEK